MGIQVNAPANAEGPIKCVAPPAKPSLRTLKRNEKLVYEALCRSPRPLKAYGLLAELQEHGLRAPMTIYRALEALIDKGWVRKIESLNAFVAVGASRTERARAFLICRECMKAKEIRLDERQVAALFSPMQVSASDVRIEAFGECHEVCGNEG